jgi:SET domain-containing protein
MKKKMFSWLNPRLEIRKTDKYGRGIYTKKDIRKGEILIVMGGHICNTDQENQLGDLATNYNMDISEEWSFCPTKKSDLNLMPQHLVNHSCEPNAGFSDQCFMISIKNIKKGEEITYDYAFVMWSSNDSKIHYELNCLCGKKSCRGKITENDWKIKTLQKKYGKYFQPFLRKKFKK